MGGVAAVFFAASTGDGTIMADHANDQDEAVATENESEPKASSETTGERYSTGIKKLDDTVYKVDAGIKRISAEFHKVADKKQ